jgi:styrene-oxide isomerase
MTAVYGNKGAALNGVDAGASVEKRVLQRVMIGHGTLMIATALLGGVGLWMFLLGGFEIIPGYIVHFQLPGSAEGWRKAHSGPVLNGLMVIGIAFALPLLDFKLSTAKILGWIIVLDGWSNVGFYVFGNLSPNRGLAFGPSVMGPSDIFSWLALGPAYLFGVLATGALFVIGFHAVAGMGRSQC